MKKLLFIALFGFMYMVEGRIYAQNYTEFLNRQASVPIPSPNVAALNKFVEFPVNHFNGQVDVSFPLYEIKLKNVSIPIRLKYNTSGLKVSEEASWVGLGWALDAGGVIYHQVNGRDDIINKNLYDDYGYYLPYVNKVDNETYDINKNLGGVSLSGAKIPNKNGQMEDIVDRFTNNYYKINGEPDVYIYSMGNYSGKFINWDKNNTGVDLSCNNMIFKQYMGTTAAGDSIIATDPDGNIYRFKNIETSISSRSSDKTTSAYYLSEIVSPNKENIKFSYKTFKQLINDNRWETSFTGDTQGHGLNDGYFPSIPSLWEECSATYQMLNSGSSVSSSSSALQVSTVRLGAYSFTNALYLDKIEFPNGTIEFVKSPRLDAFGLKLDKINIKNANNQLIKTYEFQYNYFESTTPANGQDVSTATSTTGSTKNYPADYLKKRLKLVSFSEGNYSSGQIYSFTYNESEKLPYKTSFSQDFWGYYNKQGNTTLIPSYALYASALGMPDGFGGGALGTLTTAKRNVDVNAVKAFMLKEITHPTKGKTAFTFEANTCSNSFIASNEIVTKRFSATDIGTGYARTSFTFNEKKTVDITVNLFLGSNLKYSTVLTQRLGSPYEYPNEFYAVVERLDKTSNQWILFDLKYCWGGNSWSSYNTNNYTGWAKGVTFDPGTYRLTANLPDPWAQYGGLGSTMADINLSYDTLVYTTSNYVGGLRIKQIIRTDVTTNKSMTTNYTYAQGILATRPIFMYSMITELPPNGAITCPGNGVKYVLAATPAYPYSFSANGNLVGYQRVTETYSNGEIGHIDYNYMMNNDVLSLGAYCPQGTPFTPKLTNGFLQSKIVYNNQNLYIDRKTYEYAIVNAKVYWGFKVDSWAAIMPCGVTVPSYHDVMASHMKVYFYPIVQGKLLTKQEEEEDYSSGQIPPLQRKTEYEYNAYCQLVAKKIDNSVYGKVIETYKYVPEKAAESGGVYTQMKNLNILSPLIETQTDQSGAVTKQITNYSQPYTNVFTPSNFQLGFGSSATAPETRITFDKYDKYGNPNSINKDNAGSVIYLWSYNGLYPVAEIRNSDYATVNAALSTVGLGSIESLAANANPDKAKLDNLRDVSTLANAHITTCKYSLLVGILEVTAPNRITTYYEYDAFNRLKTVKEGNKKTLEDYEYHYKN
ncbi:MAG: hypothetical protein FWF52_06690 [Candidatus Azobacteroides sp.]|nr:hypothetical protein [Candidatus Azobacteroides sp.]